MEVDPTANWRTSKCDRWRAPVLGRPGAPISSYFPIFRQATRYLYHLNCCGFVKYVLLSLVHQLLSSTVLCNSTVLYVVFSYDVREHGLLFARSRPTQCVVRIPRLNLSECTSQVLSENVLLILSQHQHGLINSELQLVD